MWTGCKPSIGHIRVFGCVAHVKVVSGQLQKLDSRSKLLVHLGVEIGTKLIDYLIRIRELYGSAEMFFLMKKDHGNGESQRSSRELQVQPSQSKGLSHKMIVKMTIWSLKRDWNFWLKTGSISSLTEGGAPKRYRTLTELHDETNEVLLLNDGEDPTSYSMACKRDEWKKAMKTELDSIERNNTWTLVELPPGRKAIGLKWVYKVKKDPTGAVIKHKARLVAKGYVQKA
ncbi:zinc finger, CCHC-type containing protein [Tanacetum coccineum]